MRQAFQQADRRQASPKARIEAEVARSPISKVAANRALFENLGTIIRPADLARAQVTAGNQSTSAALREVDGAMAANAKRVQPSRPPAPRWSPARPAAAAPSAAPAAGVRKVRGRVDAKGRMWPAEPAWVPRATARAGWTAARPTGAPSRAGQRGPTLAAGRTPAPRPAPTPMPADVATGRSRHEQDVYDELMELIDASMAGFAANPATASGRAPLSADGATDSPVQSIDDALAALSVTSPTPSPAAPTGLTSVYANDDPTPDSSNGVYAEQAPTSAVSNVVEATSVDPPRPLADLSAHPPDLLEMHPSYKDESTKGSPDIGGIVRDESKRILTEVLKASVGDGPVAERPEVADPAFAAQIGQVFVEQFGWTQADADQYSRALHRLALRRPGQVEPPGQTGPGFTVQRLSDEERDSYELELGTTINLRSTGTEFDTGGLFAKHMKKGWGIFVMSPDGRIWAGPHKVALFHHSTLSNEQDVAAAGELRVEQGRLTGLNNKSGHYKTRAWQMMAVFERLERAGVDLGTVEYVHHDGSGLANNIRTPFGTAAQFRIRFRSEVGEGVEPMWAGPSSSETWQRFVQRRPDLANMA